MRKRSGYKSHVLFFVTVLLTGCTVIMAVNYYIDPLWCFGIPNTNFMDYPDIDARLQKTNRITFDHAAYDTLVIGSSRTEHIRQTDFVGHTAFNYSVPSLYPEDLNDFIRYFSQVNRGQLKTIIIGLDFYGTNINGVDRRASLKEYTDKYRDNFYRVRHLLARDTLKYSIKTIRHKFEKYYYDRNNNKKCIALPRAVADRERINQMEKFSEVINNYRYNAGYRQVLDTVKNANEDIKIIVFTTPVSEPYFRLLIRDHFDDYERWLRDVISVFGGVYNFMYINSVTSNLDNYVDLHHFYPHIGTMIAKKVSGMHDNSMPSDFGVYVTQLNIDAHLAMVKNQLSNNSINAASQP